MKNTIVSPATDEQLIIRFINGESESLGILYGRYSRKVYHKCFSFTKDADEAYDLAQEILLKAFEKVSMFKGDSKFSTWLYSVTFNHCVEYFRKKQHMILEDISRHFNLAEEDADIEEIELHEQREENVISLLDNIAENDKEMLVMKYQYNYSIKELQAMFSLSSSAVKMRLSRARQKVEKIYNLNNRMPVAI